jgi:hypothetical protein
MPSSDKKKRPRQVVERVGISIAQRLPGPDLGNKVMCLHNMKCAPGQADWGKAPNFNQIDEEDTQNG